MAKLDPTARTNIGRSSEMVLAAYFLARFSKNGEVPEFLDGLSWREVYEKMYPSIGGGRTFKTFCASMGPVRGHFNHHFDNGGPIHRDNKGKIPPMGKALVSVASEWDERSDGDLLEVMREYFPNLGQPGRARERLPNASQRLVSANHIHIAVDRLLDGQDAPNFAESRDYDVILEDGTRLAPKKVFGLALEEALGIEAFPHHFSAGWTQPCFEIIQAAGYRIAPKGAPSPNEIAAALTDLPHEQADLEAIEGSLKLVSHFRRERASGLARKKKAAFLAQHGRLFCERCGLEPSSSYNAVVADACIEVHHSKVQVKDMGNDHLTSLDDLQCLCANCHRVTHKELAFGLR